VSVGTRTVRLPSTSVRARLLAWGLLASLVIAIVVTVTSTLGSHATAAHANAPKSGLTTAGGAVARSRCCWIVKPGQTLYSIAARESVLPSAIERANPRVAPARLHPGQRVRIPT
jgi:LysM repeat protein